MNKANGPVDRIKLGLGLGLLAALMGCVGYVGGGYGGMVVVPEPDIYVFGGYYEGGRDVHDYSHRGVESRAAAHPGGRGSESRTAPARSTSSAAAHAGGGESGKKR